MRVTQWGELGVLCAIEVAKGTVEPESSISALEISRTLDIDLQYAQQILHRLKKGSILKSVRGPKGGYSLMQPAAFTTLREILNAAEGRTFEIICETHPLDEDRCNPSHSCNLRPIWYRLRDHINEFLVSVTLLDLINNPVEQILVQIQSHRDRHPSAC